MRKSEKTSIFFKDLKIKNLTSNEYLEDNIEGASPSAIWSADSQYLLYTKKDEVTLISNKVYVHKIGDDQSQDILIYEEKDNEFNIYIGESRSKKCVRAELQLTSKLVHMVRNELILKQVKVIWFKIQEMLKVTVCTGLGG